MQYTKEFKLIFWDKKSKFFIVSGDWIKTHHSVFGHTHTTILLMH